MQNVTNELEAQEVILRGLKSRVLMEKNTRFLKNTFSAIKKMYLK